MKKIIFTKEGFEKLKKETEKLKEERMLAVLDLKKAREMGDLSENGYYKSARFKLNDIDRAIRRNSYLIKNAMIKISSNTSFVDIGLRVKVEIDGEEKDYQLVGEYEANPQEGRISHLSPVGKALMGKKVNEEVIVQLGDNKKIYKIKEIKK